MCKLEMQEGLQMTKATRKTVAVGEVLHSLNYFLANDKGLPEEREVMIQFVEGILFRDCYTKYVFVVSLMLLRQGNK